MILDKKIWFAGIISVALLIIGFSAQLTHASPQTLVITSPVATTTPTFVSTTQNATSTVLDTYGQPAPSGYGFDRNVLLMQYAASSTSAVLSIRYQYSKDNIDWYDDDTGTATTTVFDVSAANSFKWTPTGTATSSKMITAPTPTRYTRAIFTVTGANGAIWYDWQPQRQAPGN